MFIVKSNSGAVFRWKEYQRLVKRIAPTLVSNRTFYDKVLCDHVSDQTIWLDAGCGHILLGSRKADEERELVQRARFVCGCDGDVEAILRHRRACPTNPLTKDSYTMGGVPM